jgi:hypothetical protein
MSSSKDILSTVAVALTILGYVGYIRDCWAGRTRPHVFSWFMWGLIPTAIFFVQIQAGAQSGALPTLALAVTSLMVFAISLSHGTPDIKKIDIVFLALAVLATMLWIVTDNPTVAVALFCGVEIVAFCPTIRKSWRDPYSETLSMYAIATIRHSITIASVATYNFATVAFPATWVAACVFFCCMVQMRRKHVGAPSLGR